MVQTDFAISHSKKNEKREWSLNTVYSRWLSGGSSIVTVGSFPIPIPHQHLDAWGSANDYDPRGAAAAIGSNPTPSTSRPKRNQEQFEVIFYNQLSSVYYLTSE